MTKQLTAQTATITTAAVQVQTLTISGKQVTLAVYRQLIDEPLITGEGELRGTPWGTVNHCPDKKYWNTTTYKLADCATGPEHLHVVWQKDDQLRRARVELPTWGRACLEFGDTFVQAAFCTNDHQLPAWMRSVHIDGCREVFFTRDGLTCEADYPEHSIRSGHECLDGADLERLEAVVSDEVAEERQRRQRHYAHWKTLADLPQLFIAV